MAVGEKFPVVMGKEKAEPQGVATLDDSGILIADQWPLTTKWQSNENLLDNWYWAAKEYIINQRRLENYSGSGYNIDRWISNNSGNQVEITENNGIKLTLNGGGKYLQLFENLPKGIYTYSILAEVIDNIKAPSLTCSTKEWGKRLIAGLTSNTFEWNGGGFSIGFIGNSEVNEFCSAYIKAVKLELGPNQTLAHKEGDTWVLNDPPPDYGLELMKCQKYQFELFDKNLNTQAYIMKGKAINTTQIWGQVFTPVTMRRGGIPSLITDCSNSNPYFAFGIIGGVYEPRITIGTLGVYGLQENGVIIAAYGNDFIPGNDYQVYVDNQNQHQFFLDRNL